MDLPISTPSTSSPQDIVDRWGGWLKNQLMAHYAGRLELEWTQDADEPGQDPPAILQWLTLRKGSRQVGNVCLSWHPNQPESLRIGTATAKVSSTPVPEGPVSEALTWVAALAGLGGWIWFVIVDGHRVWNRVSTFAGGYDAKHATKLEVYLMAMGWFLGPVLGIILLQILRAGIEGLGKALQRLRAGAFARRELDQVLEGLLQNRLQACREQAEDCLAFGQAHPGSPHPVHANLVWGKDGKCLPTEGYQWASEDLDSLGVAPKA